MNEVKFNRVAVHIPLSGAKIALEEILKKVESGSYDQESPMVMAIDFEQVLYRLCLAWHFRYITDEARMKMTSEDYIRLSKTGPNFGFELKLMKGIDPEELETLGQTGDHTL